jgi:putative ABC transport system permease protein
MQSVFGLPAGPLAATLAVILALTAGIVTVLGVRNRVFVKIGVRNIPRRRARSALIVVGLMLGTAIIASALLTGDTMGSTIRASVFESLGSTDEIVTGASTDVGVEGSLGVEAAKPYFDAGPALAAVDAAVADLPVDGVSPAIIEPVAAQHRAAGRTEPRLTLFAGDPARLEAFGFRSVADLGAGEVLLDADAAEELRAAAGDTLLLLAGERLVEVTVAGIDDRDGTGTDASAAVLGLTDAQELLGVEGQVNHVIVSNDGDRSSGARHSDAVVAALDDAVAPLGLTADPVKQDGLETADAQGNAFMALFTTFGSFSVAAGILLIFLIFVMLASERRSEMGMSRAVGTQRRHLVQTFLYEGAVYDLLAAAVGTALGIVVSFVMVQVTASAFADEEIDLVYSLSLRSLVIAYALGVLLTLVIVTLSAWRVSRLNIVSAIRDTPEPPRRRRRRRWVPVVAGTVLGGLMAVSGVQGDQYLPWMLGVSIVVLSLVPLLRILGVRDRIAYTVGGVALVGWWLLPLDALEGVLGPMEMDFGIWIASGLLLVVGSTWLVTYNADLLLGAVTKLASRSRKAAPVVKMAVTYPLRSRFRTAVTLSMFTLVVFTLVTGTTISTSFIRAFDDLDRFGGGFDVRATTAPALAVDDLGSALPEELRDDVVAVGSQSFVPVEAAQEGTDAAFATYPLRGVDAGFVDTTTYGFSAMATGYDSPGEVWAAVRDEPGLAVVDGFVVPRRQNWGAGVLPDFQLSGFFLEDGTFDPVVVDVRDAQTGTELEVTVIGVLADTTPFEMAGITVSQEVLVPLGDRAAPNVHHLALRPGADADAAASTLEGAFLDRGLEAESYRAALDEAVGSSLTFNYLVLGFMGLGLLVGVAALGVVSARAVVERRQQLGVLRAIGFQPAMIRRSLVLESSFVSLTAIVVGAGLALVISNNVVADAAEQPGFEELALAVPWVSLAVVFAVVFLAAVATSLIPAMRASRVYPAEALRYQ